MRPTERVEHQAFPRVAALAEVTWSPAATRNWPGFASRLGAQFARYRSSASISPTRPSSRDGAFMPGADAVVDMRRIQEAGVFRRDPLHA